MVSYGTASFLTQADALLRKNLIYQRRNIKQNIILTIYPVFLCLLIISIQSVVNNELDKPRYHCGCKCIDANGSGTCRDVCGVQFSTSIQAIACPVPRPQEWPALVQVPSAKYRAVRAASHNFRGLPDGSCFKDLSCAATSLFTGQNESIAKSLVKRILLNSIPENKEDISSFVSVAYLGTNSIPGPDNYVERGLLSQSPVHLILPLCSVKFNLTVPVTIGDVQNKKEVNCIKNLYLWRENSSIINEELFQGYRKGNPAHKISEYVGAYDFLNTSKINFNVNLWYNSTYSNRGKPRLLRVPRTLNMVSNAFLRQFKSSKSRILLSYVKEMPKAGTRIALDLSELLGPLLYSWVVQLLLPVFLISLVHDKQHMIRIMMKVHGLGDGPYWVITYCHFLSISFLYMLWLATFGSIIGLDIFRLNNYCIQFLFYGLYINLQIVLAFLAGIGFSDVHSAAVVGYIYVFGSGLLGSFLFQFYIEHLDFSRKTLFIMELIPGFSLYRGLYELSQFALGGHYQGTYGMQWKDLSEHDNGIKEVLVIMALEWLILLYVSYYLDQLALARNGACRYSSIFTRNFKNRSIQPTVPIKIPSSTITVDQENSDIFEEVCKVENLLKKSTGGHPIILSNLEKVYTGKDGNPNKQAVHSLSLAVAKGECLGMLGPNGSGKTTVINMVTGLLLPTSGRVFLSNKEISSSMDNIHTKIGICPQKDLLWDSLSGREHLMFYGRLRNLKGLELQQAVDNSLRSLDLYEGNVGDHLAGTYSGGMKRRLSVAISLIGDTQVVLLDEPTTGLDPDSRNYLWHAIKLAKRDRAIILTTHLMDEAEFLCDRLAIIVNGRLRCVGSSSELKTRYEGSYQLTISADPINKDIIEDMVTSLCSDAMKIYDVIGTQRFRLPKQVVRVQEIFKAIEVLKRRVAIHAFEVTGTSMEDVFSNVVNHALESEID
uniref:ABC transporter domain-containing protein n=1 Tax=Musa acuminata subsp. malaccensis TaxID=214687 RepID=A0A804K389_MUSAM|nr:PREDICTED: ABC transporter A family member 8-like [Musa acuminata subsp. malaccensis]